MGDERTEAFRRNLLRRAGRLRVAGVPTTQLQEAIWLQTGQEIPASHFVPGELDRPFLGLVPWGGRICPGCHSGLIPSSKICHTCARAQVHNRQGLSRTESWRIDHILQAVIPPGTLLFDPDSLLPARTIGREIYSRFYPKLSPPEVWFPEDHKWKLDPRTPEWLGGSNTQCSPHIDPDLDKE